MLRSSSVGRLTFTLCLAGVLLLPFALLVYAGTPLDTAGYLDFSYGTNVKEEPTSEKPESKLWWNDGFWWGVLYNDRAGEYHIYRLNWGTQTWEDTGTAVDDREDAKADVLWDDASSKLYIASHFRQSNPGETSNPNDWGYVYRYSYSPDTLMYTLDSGFPVNVNEDKSETLVLDKDSNDRLWVTYVTRKTAIDPNDYQVFVNATSANDDDAWGTPISLTDFFTEAHVALDDISSLIAFNNQIGVMWSNQIEDKFYFAVHDDSSPPASGWTLHTLDPVAETVTANDHINLAKSSADQVFAAVKTENSARTDPLVGLFALDTDGSLLAFNEFSDVSSKDTRPIVVVNDDENKVYMFATSNPIGGRICYKSAPISDMLAGNNFSQGPCEDTGPSSVPLFIADGEYDNINNATSTKQPWNTTTGLVVLASDDVNGKVYVHNVSGNPPPVVINVSPEVDATDVSLDTVAAAVFSKDMNQATINTTNLTMEESAGSIAGTVGYDAATRTATFTPTSTLKASTIYTVTVSDNVQDTTGQGLFRSRSWSFTTVAPAVRFAAGNFTVDEDVASGTATVTATLNAPSSKVVTVDYATSDGTATDAGPDDDYDGVSGTLTFAPGDTVETFTVPINDDGVDEGNETVNVSLNSPTNASLGSPDSATLTIVDDERTTVQFESTSHIVDEAVGSRTVTVKLNNPAASTVTVDYHTSDGSATAPGDYIAASGTLTFTPGTATQTFAVTVNDDALDEVDETVDLTLSNPTNAQLGTPGDTATLTIEDNDPAPTVRYSSASYSVAEGAGTASVTVTLSAPSAKTVMVQYATADDTARDGAPEDDYDGASGTLTFAPGDTEAVFSITINDDALDEPNETVNLSLSAPSNASLGTPSTASLSILDDDAAPTVQFSAASYTVDEDAGSATITVNLSAPSAKSITVDYATSDDSATAGDDYSSAADTLLFSPGDTSATFTVDIDDDFLAEPTETVQLTLSNADDATLNTPSTASLSIVDNEHGIFLPLVVRQ